VELAYADPPYLGCGHRYPEHPDAKRWDHVEAHHELLRHLDESYDGWAFSLSSTSLRPILAAAPPCRIGVWVKPFAAFKRNVRIAYTWEPVLWKPARDSSADGAPVGRDHLAAVITLKRGLTGAKPDKFNRWVLDLMGYTDGDKVDDLFPGTSGMGREVARQVLL
jgi:hypothetical protein